MDEWLDLTPQILGYLFDRLAEKRKQERRAKEWELRLEDRHFAVLAATFVNHSFCPPKRAMPIEDCLLLRPEDVPEASDEPKMSVATKMAKLFGGGS